MTPDYSLPLVAVVRNGAQTPFKYNFPVRLVYERPGPIRRFAADNRELGDGMTMESPQDFIKFVALHGHMWELVNAELDMDIDL